mgnify:FL=1
MTENQPNQEEASKSDRFFEEKQGLAEIDRKLKEVNDAREAPSKLASKIKQPPGNVLGLAMRVSVEVVSALAIGFAIGWSLDQWLDTRPWLMLVFLLIGGAAGIINVYRMASGFGYGDNYGQAEENTEDKGDLRKEE